MTDRASWAIYAGHRWADLEDDCVDSNASIATSPLDDTVLIDAHEAEVRGM